MKTIEKTKVKRVNHGNVFNTGSWFTFHCESCGSQVMPRAEKCKGTSSFIRGCGADLDWEIPTSKTI